LGVDLKTVKSWFSILEASFIVFFLQSHHRNFTKRLVKTPKLYFYDTGLACSLLGIRQAADLDAHWARSALFENMVITDLMKAYFNRGETPPLYYWRDSSGNEVDCLIDAGGRIKIVEIKSSATVVDDFFKGLKYYKNLDAAAEGFLVYGGDVGSFRNEITVLSWQDAARIAATS